jgi:crossover junction endodeoxyribonuclease RuvC
VKQSIVGTGRATKPQVQEMVKRLLRLSRAPGTDAADALGVAICAAHHAQIPKAITNNLVPKKSSKK